MPTEGLAKVVPEEIKHDKLFTEIAKATEIVDEDIEFMQMITGNCVAC
jgi:hypothetical protein